MGKKTDRFTGGKRDVLHCAHIQMLTCTQDGVLLAGHLKVLTRGERHALRCASQQCRGLKVSQTVFQQAVLAFQVTGECLSLLREKIKAVHFCC
ncbi:hypothetical protein D3C80_1105780 [compost metagenome]